MALSDIPQLQLHCAEKLGSKFAWTRQVDLSAKSGQQREGMFRNEVGDRLSLEHADPVSFVAHLKADGLPIVSRRSAERCQRRCRHRSAPQR